jgi:hypothetical protein
MCFPCGARGIAHSFFIKNLLLTHGLASTIEWALRKSLNDTCPNHACVLLNSTDEAVEMEVDTPALEER